MASEKKPSIYEDRCTVGSSSELDEYGVWIKSGPEDLSPGGGDINAGEPDGLPNPDIPEVYDVGAEPEPDDFSPGDTAGGDSEISFDESLNLNNLDDLKADFPVSDDQFDLSAEEPQASDGDGDYKEISLDDFLDKSGESVSPPDAEGSLPEESSGLESFDTELSLPDSFGADTFEPEASSLSETSSSAEAPAPEKADSPEISTQLLKQIAEELASIRSELSSLKEEFSQTRGGVNPEPKPAKDSSHGFFDGEDDEKIALTGDELDNIINTAEFIQETGEDVANSEEMEALLNVEVKPVTPAPEDTTYLDESPLADESPLPDENAESPSLSTEESGSSDLDLSSFDLDEQNVLLADSTGDDPAGETSDDITSDISPDDIPPGDDSTGEIALDEAPAGEISLDDVSIDDIDTGDISIDETAVGDTSVDDTNAGDIGTDDSSLEMENSLDLPAIDLDLEEADESLPDDAGEETLEEGGAEDELEIPLSDFPENLALEGVEAGEDLIPESFTGETGETLEETVVDDEKIPVDTASSEPPPATEGADLSNIPPAFGDELRTVLSYMDRLLESLPEEKIEEFAQSEYFDTYKKLFKELGLN